ncbi:hypothetical protein NQ487_13945 [Hungatella hathewayi]|nr:MULTISPECIES: hypothetical protein [Hungatella]MCI7384743.1 hypothetical protein [Hungatella sp.]MDY6239100.1 hypothetical protein [Hungatella hathewayi]UWO87941.1 hypothetical protein NQ487_13945 [Hungatella hathewayi]
MLEHSDLQAIRDIMKEEIGRSENLLKDNIKTEIGRSENLLRDTIKAEIGRSENLLRDNIKTEIERSENLLRDTIKAEIGRSENLVLSEVDRVQENLETKMEQLKRNMDELTQYYRTVKLDHENNALFLQMIQELKKEMEQLKIKIA